jgi:hypothetical protein
MQTMSPIELSKLTAFVDITVYENDRINNLDKPKKLNFNTSQINTAKFRGTYGLEKLELLPTGLPVGIIFDINLHIKVFNSDLLDSDDPIVCLTKLNNSVRVDFG